MADVGRLRWILQADTRQFENAMQRTTFALRRLGRTAATILGVGGIGRGITSVLGTVDAMAKLAANAGLSVEALQRLRFAAEEAGIPTAQFEDSLLAFNRRLGELQVGGGPLLQFLRRFDAQLATDLFTIRDTEEALFRLSRAVQQAPTQAIGAALTMQAFGRGGLRATEFLRQGPQALRGAMMRAPEPPVTTEIAETIQRTNDAFLRAQETVNAQILDTLFTATRAVVEAANDVRDWFREIREEGFLASIGRGIASLFGGDQSRTSQ